MENNLRELRLLQVISLYRTRPRRWPLLAFDLIASAKRSKLT